MEYLQVLPDFLWQELLILVLCLFLLGEFIKQANFINSKYIPVILGLIGIIAAAVYIYANGVFENKSDLVFAAFTQGLLCAGGAVYVDQIFKQLFSKNNK